MLVSVTVYRESELWSYRHPLLLWQPEGRQIVFHVYSPLDQEAQLSRVCIWQGNLPKNSR
jgi:hypothetical protein